MYFNRQLLSKLCYRSEVGKVHSELVDQIAPSLICDQTYYKVPNLGHRIPTCTDMITALETGIIARAMEVPQL